MKRLLLSPSLMCANLLNVNDDLKKLSEYNFQFLHVDIMDGHFVPNITFGFDYTNKLSEYSKFPKYIHLMMDYPDLAIRNLVLDKNDVVVFHIESKGDPNYTIATLKTKKVKIGLAINPDTPIETLFPFLDIINHVLVMSVHPGFAGHPFVKNSYRRIYKLVSIVQKKYPDVIIGVDGAIGFKQVKTFNRMGVDLFVLGTTALFKNNLSKQLIKLDKFIKDLKGKK